MSPLSLLCIVASCSAVALIAISLRLNPRAALNRALTLLAFFYALWALGVAVVTSARTITTVQFFNAIAAIGYVYGVAAYLTTCLVFTGARLPTMLILNVPVYLVSTVELVQAFTGEWVISGFRPGPWGNVGLLSTNRTWPAIDLAVHLFVLVAASVALLRARSRSHSRRFRSIALYSFLCLVLTAVLSGFCIRIVWQRWGYPEPSVLLGMIGIAVDIYLVEMYRFLSLDHPRVEREVIGAVEDAIVLFDAHLAITRANKAAAVVFGREPSELVGADLASLFGESTEIRSSWQTAVTEKEKERKTTCSFQGAQLVMTLSPVFDEFGDLVGGVAIVRTQDSLDVHLSAHGITARERSIVFMLMQGFTNKQIADSLFIAPNTVKNHVANIYQKTGAGTRVELFRLLLSDAHREPAAE